MSAPLDAITSAVLAGSHRRHDPAAHGGYCRANDGDHEEYLRSDAVVSSMSARQDGHDTSSVSTEGSWRRGAVDVAQMRGKEEMRPATKGMGLIAWLWQHTSKKVGSPQKTVQ